MFLDSNNAARRDQYILSGLLLLVLAAELALGRMRPWYTPDTAGYLNVAAWPQCFGGRRFPLYGWIAGALKSIFGGYGVLPWLQFTAYAAAAHYLVRRLAKLTFSGAARTAIAVALGLSNVLLVWTSATLPFMFAVAALLVMLAEVAGLAASGARCAGLLRLGVFQCLAWLLWPGLLPFLVISPCMVFTLAAGRDAVRRLRLALLVFVAGLAPCLAISTLRLETVGDFNVSSFGGFQMSGMAALMLNPDVVARLPADDQALATAILLKRTALEQQRVAIATPLNSTGQPSFVSEALGYPDILARTHDAVLYGDVIGQRAPGESWVAFNNRLQHFALAVLRVDKGAYLAWIIGCLCRACGHIIVTTPAFILPSCALMALVCLRSAPPSAGDRNDLHFYQFVILTTLGILSPCFILTFPALRYLDNASLLVPALPIYALLVWCRPAGYGPAAQGDVARMK
jgi:hypothetical protein